MAREFDSPWKEAIDLFFEQFLFYFFPRIHAAIDWTRGFTSLDTELQEIVREGEVGNTVADKLIRVFLRDGADLWLLIHLEVQAQTDPEFARRMFVYYYRILDRYNRDVVSIAILGDDSKTWRPDEFAKNTLGTDIRFRFNIVKLLDWCNPQSLEELESGSNPFGLVVVAHLESLQTHGAPQIRRQAKWRLIRRLYEFGWPAERVRQLYRIIDWFLELPRELQEELRNDLHAFEKEKQMPYITSTERLAREEGREQGREEGREQGREEGREEGREQGREEGRERGRREELQETLFRSLEFRFEKDGLTLANEVRQITDLPTLRAIHQAILSGRSLEELRRLL